MRHFQFKFYDEIEMQQRRSIVIYFMQSKCYGLSDYAPLTSLLVIISSLN